MPTKKETREAHVKEILKHLQSGYVVTQTLARKLWDCPRLAARIFELKGAGYKIESKMVFNSATGEKYAEYTLEGVAPKVYTEKAMRGKSVVDYSRALNQPNFSNLNVERLF